MGFGNARNIDEFCMLQFNYVAWGFQFHFGKISQFINLDGNI